MDSTLIAAPSSTKNKEKQRDPEAHSVKKGNQWYFGYKEHIGVDCSAYCYDEAYQRGIYTWYADEDDACSLSLFFGDNGKLIAAGAYNLS